jgi:hypothetical protein
VVATPSPLLVDSQTLSAGSLPITVSGTVWSLQTDGSSVVIGGTTTYAVGDLTGTTGIGGVIATIEGPNPPASTIASELIVNSQTLSAGSSALTVACTAWGLQPGGLSLVLGGTTTHPVGDATALTGISGVNATIGGFDMPTPTYVQVSGSLSGSNGTMVTGATSRLLGETWVLGLVAGLGVMGVLWL